MLTPTDKAAIEGLLKLIQPIESTDERIPDIQWIELGEAAFEAREALQRLLAGETREADKPAGRIYWLIERITHGYGNRDNKWLAVYVAPEKFSRGFFWTDKSNVAFQFARKEDAEKMLAALEILAEPFKADTRFAALHEYHNGHPTEHMDCYGPASEDPHHG